MAEGPVEPAAMILSREVLSLAVIARMRASCAAQKR